MFENNQQINDSCIFCKDRSLENLPLVTNCDTSQTFALIAQGSCKKEIVLHVDEEKTYGIEINFCPICGRNLIRA